MTLKNAMFVIVGIDMLFSLGLIIGLIIGFLLKTIHKFYYYYDWFRNYRKYSVLESIKQAFKDVWN